MPLNMIIKKHTENEIRMIAPMYDKDSIRQAMKSCIYYLNRGVSEEGNYREWVIEELRKYHNIACLIYNKPLELE